MNLIYVIKVLRFWYYCS